MRSLLSSAFYDVKQRKQLTPFEEVEGCVASPGPYPNSVRYDHSPEALAQAPERAPSILTSCLKRTIRRNSFVVVQYDDKGAVSMVMICRGDGRVACAASFYWNEVWRAAVHVSRAYLQRIPEFIERLKTHFDTFAAAANAQS